MYGRKPVEWDTLAAWVVQNRLYSDNNVWMIQVRRGREAGRTRGCCRELGGWVVAGLAL